MTNTQTDSIPVKTAVSNAIEFVRELYKSEEIKDILLEEVEFSESTNQWLITIGFMRNNMKDQSSSIASLILSEKENVRKYKIVYIDAQSGEPISMKIREI